MDTTLGRDEWRRTMRHELRTPVNHILAFAQLLREDAEDAGDADFVAELHTIEEAGKQALSLIGHMLQDGEAPDEAGALSTSTAALRTIVGTVTERATTLAAKAAAEGRSDAVQDLGRVATGAMKLDGLLDELVAALRTDTAVVTGEAMAAPADRNGAPSEPGSPAPEGQAASEPPSTTLTGRILVVEDDDLSRVALVRMLERLGHTLIWAGNGREALDILDSQPVDLVLLDIMMPVMNGYQVLDRRRGSQPLRDIPFVMISALDELSSVVRCIEMGAEDYLPKPFDPVLLRARIGACLEKKRLRDQEVEYLRQVAAVTAAAAAVEDRTFRDDALAEVAAREDALGQLARVFHRMAHEVLTREEQLRRQVQQLQFQVDEARKSREVSQITDTDYFRGLQSRAAGLRERVRAGNTARDRRATEGDRPEGAD